MDFYQFYTSPNGPLEVKDLSREYRCRLVTAQEIPLSYVADWVMHECEIENYDSLVWFRHVALDP